MAKPLNRKMVIVKSSLMTILKNPPYGKDNDKGKDDCIKFYQNVRAFFTYIKSLMVKEACAT